jgi:hypothetical protein
MGRLGDGRRYLFHTGGGFNDGCSLLIGTLSQILVTVGNITAGVTEYQRARFNFLHDMLNVFDCLIVGAIKSRELVATRYIEAAGQIAVHLIDGFQRVG